MFLGGARLASIFATVAAAQSFTATYAISSFDNPQFFVNNPDTIPPRTHRGHGRRGLQPRAGRRRTSQLRLPDRQGREGVRSRSTQTAGISFDSREAARVALPYCDAARLLKLAGDEVDGDLNAATLGRGRRRRRHGLQHRGRVRRRARPESHAAAGAYRVMRYDDRLRRASSTRATTLSSPDERIAADASATRPRRSRSTACRPSYGPLQVLFEASPGGPATARWSRCSVPTASARARCSRSSPGCCAATPARCGSAAST